MKQNKKVWDWRTYVVNYAPENASYRHILLTLSLYMNGAGESCFPSIDTLCKDTCLSKPTVIKYLKQANNDGWIEITKHGYGDQRWRRNEYRADIPDKVVKQVNHEGGKGGKTDKKGGKTDNEKVVNLVNSNTTENTSNNNTTMVTDSDLPNYTLWNRSDIENIDQKHKEDLLSILEKSKYLITVDIPDGISRADEYWIRKWFLHLQDKGKRPTIYTQQEMLNDLKSMDVKKVVKHSIKNGWVSLHQPKKDTNGLTEEELTL